MRFLVVAGFLAFIFIFGFIGEALGLGKPGLTNLFGLGVTGFLAAYYYVVDLQNRGK